MTNIDDVSVHDRDRTHAVLLRHMVSQSSGHIAPGLGRGAGVTVASQVTPANSG